MRPEVSPSRAHGRFGLSCGPVVWPAYDCECDKGEQDHEHEAEVNEGVHQNGTSSSSGSAGLAGGVRCGCAGGGVAAPVGSNT